MRAAIVDTGPLVAFLDRAEQHHRWVAEKVEELNAPLLVCEPVLAEGNASARAFLDGARCGCSSKMLRSGSSSAWRNLPALRKLNQKYRDRPTSLADACIVRMAEIYERHAVLTLDSDFSVSQARPSSAGTHSPGGAVDPSRGEEMSTMQPSVHFKTSNSKRAALIVFGLGLLLISPDAPASESLPLNSDSWSTITSGGTVPLRSVDGTLSFDFPVAVKGNGTSDATINALMTKAARSLAGAGHLTATFKVATTGVPTFKYMFEPSNTCAHAAHVRLWFARAGWRSGGEYHRWWANRIAYQLAPGSVTLNVPLTPNHWSSVFGKPGTYQSDSRDGFQAAMQNVAEVGLVFGGGCFFGHGVNVSGGTAQFILTNYGIL